MRDFYPDDMALRNLIFDSWRMAAERFGFSPYDSCVVESLDLLKRKGGEDIVRQIYEFTDKSGRALALRPEMTPTLARMIAARQGSLPLPLKWYAVAQCFRYERMTRGRKREHYQWNLDIIGEEGVAAEAEIIAAATCALSLMGLRSEQYRVHYSSRALLADLLRASGVPPEHHQPTFLALDKRGKISDEEIRELLTGEGLDIDALDRVFSILAIQTLDEAAERLDSGDKSVLDLRAFIQLLDAYGLTDVMQFDISVVRGLAYYTGIVFECFDAAHDFRAVFGGGRYENLLQDVGGKPAVGVGLGFGDVVIGELLTHLGLTADRCAGGDIAVGFMQEPQRTAALRLAARLRGEHKNVDLALHPEKPKQFFARADKAACSGAVYIGPDDVDRGEAKLKAMATREESSISLD